MRMLFGVTGFSAMDVTGVIVDNMTTLKRKLYKRGSSFETTIPMPMLFSLDLESRHNVLFKFDQSTNRWYVDFEKAGEEEVSAKRGVKR
ncbi:MAG: hypothetical protein V1729_03620 [Candidatus Woesearchaeota archaeon]